MSEINRHGLTRRSLDSETIRKIRQREGFGCVICGFAIYDYEHVDPEFSEAKEHDPEKMTLLCPLHHSLVTRRILSKKSVQEAMKSPACKSRGYSRGVFDIGNERPYVTVGGVKFRARYPIIHRMGQAPICIDEPEEPGGPFRLSATFRSEKGDAMLSIKENEWQGSTDNWDIECSGPRIIVRERAKKIGVILRADPPDGIIVERMRLYLPNGERVEANPESLSAYLPDGRLHRRLSDCTVQASLGGIFL